MAAQFKVLAERCWGQALSLAVVASLVLQVCHWVTCRCAAARAALHWQEWCNVFKKGKWGDTARAPPGIDAEKIRQADGMSGKLTAGRQTGMQSFPASCKHATICLHGCLIVLLHPALQQAVQATALAVT